MGSDMRQVAIVIVLGLLIMGCASRKTQVKTDMQKDIAYTLTEQSKQVDSSWVYQATKRDLSIVKLDKYTTTTTEVIYSAPDSTGVQYKVAERKQVTEGSSEADLKANEDKSSEQVQINRSEDNKSNQLDNKTKVATKEVKQSDARPPVPVYIIAGIVIAIGVYFLWKKVKRYIP